MSRSARHAWRLVALVGGVCVAVGLAGWGVRTWCVMPYRVPSISMAPTLEIGDHVLAWRPAFAGDLTRGTVVAFRYPKDRSVTYLKRVIGLPGDEIRFDGNRPEITGVPVQHGEPVPGAFVDEACAPLDVSLVQETIGDRTWTVAMKARPGILARAQKVVVPAGQLYVVGDNRDASIDSRAWGFVPVDDVIGTVDRVWFSFDPCARRSRPERVGPVR